MKPLIVSSLAFRPHVHQLWRMELQGQGLGLTEMINAMAAQQHMYTAAAAYGSLEAAAYAQYPHPRRDRDHRDYRDYDRDRDNYEDERTDYKSQPPNNTIMVRGLAQHITENDIRADILACNLMPKDIRLVRKKESGNEHSHGP
ncbi:putative RNA-binding protein 5-like [Penaeus vannamei]|uniref:Putative RNA-binding protein 5-like n=1 Tax=Penaeus vannamei TaxID=6689 RepID=A0A3R7PHR3_PENVA|nr:putative RNA-binding protein 5-like [Penaeus vannamei]